VKNATTMVRSARGLAAAWGLFRSAYWLINPRYQVVAGVKTVQWDIVKGVAL